MAEIKSAIELAMEKTKDLVMDDREKRSLALKELAAGMMTIYRRYREGLSGDDETKAQLDALECDSIQKRKMALDILTDEFEAGDDVAGMAPCSRSSVSWSTRRPAETCWPFNGSASGNSKGYAVPSVPA